MEEQFLSLNQTGERLAVTAGLDSDSFNTLPYSVLNRDKGYKNHFQGVQRLGQHLLVTGGYPYRQRRSDLFVLRFASRHADPGPWGSNLMSDRTPPKTDCLAQYFKIDGNYWHAGGFDVLDTCAIIPLENSEGESKIVFLDLADPEEPKHLTAPVIERGRQKAGAVAITRLADGRQLLAVWSDSDEPQERVEPKAPFHLDLYVSRDASFDHFSLVAKFFPPEGHPFHKQFQSLDFIWEGGEGCTESLFLFAFENTGAIQPLPRHVDFGRNLAYLFKVDLTLLCMDAEEQKSAKVPALEDCFVTLQGTPREFDDGGKWANMDAGSCAYVDMSQQLIVYSVYHWIDRLRGGGDFGVKALEFRATKFASSIANLENAWVDLYEKRGFAGRRVALFGRRHSSIENAQRVFADGRHFAITKSLRCQIPPNSAFVLYRERDFGGDGPLVIVGDGSLREIDVVEAEFPAKFGACRFEPASVAVQLPGAIIM